MSFKAKLLKGGLRAIVEASLPTEPEKKAEPLRATSICGPLLQCRCDHPHTVHAGGIGSCAMLECKCSEFKQGSSKEPPTSFQKVVQEMGR